MKSEYFGVGCVSNISSLLEAPNIARVFLVTGKKSFITSGAQNILAPYLAGKKVEHFYDFSENPKVDDVKKGIDRHRLAQSDIVIAVGGGSVIDMAKLINIISSNSNDTENLVSGKDKIKVNGLPLIAIPTTAGSGSEATHFAVVYMDNVKYSLAHKYILPDYVFIDPSLTYNLPPTLSAVSGFDALSQAVESYWAVASNEQSQKYAYEAIKMTLLSIKSAVLSQNLEARNKMMLAANLAGKAINITKTTAAHAISYPLTTHFNIPHGHAVALLLGRFFIINSSISRGELHDKRGSDYLRKKMRELCDLFECKSPEDCSNKWYSLMEEVGLETDFKSLGIRQQSDIDLIINKVNVERLDNNPIDVTETIIRQLFAQT